MKFGWINLMGATMVLIMLVPNVIYAFRDKAAKDARARKDLLVIEQIGRYGCIILMWLPLCVWKFGFASKEGLFLYLLGNGGMLLAYLAMWASYFRRQSPMKAMALAVLPAGIFLLSGFLLRHWLLVAFSLLFGIGHITVTRLSAQ